MIDLPKSKIQNPKSTDPVIVITGPTASGKSALAMELAEKYGGEIICADSRTVYRGLDIGTAKPSSEDRALVRHWLLDVAGPDEVYTAADFQRDAREAIADIQSRGRVPFVVGGTGLYIDGLVLDYHFGSVADPAYRQELEQKTVEELRSMILTHQLPLPQNEFNKRYLMRVLEQKGINTSRKNTKKLQFAVVAIETSMSNIEQRIRLRANEMFKDTVVKEATMCAAQYGWDCEAMKGNIYPILHDYIDGDITLEQAKEKFIIKDRQLVKKQITWLKRHDYVRWLTLVEARKHLSEILPAQESAA